MLLVHGLYLVSSASRASWMTGPVSMPGSSLTSGTLLTFGVFFISVAMMREINDVQQLEHDWRQLLHLRFLVVRRGSRINERHTLGNVAAMESSIWLFQPHSMRSPCIASYLVDIAESCHDGKAVWIFMRPIQEPGFAVLPRKLCAVYLTPMFIFGPEIPG